MKITDFTKFATLSDEDRKAQFAKMDDEALSASLADAKAEGTRIFALDNPTVEDANKAEAVVTAMGLMEAEDAERKAVVTAAAEKFAKAKAQFAVNDGVEDSEDGDEDETDEDETDEVDESDEDETDEDDESDDSEDESDDAETVEAATKKKKNPFDKDKDEEAVTTAAAAAARRALPKSATAASKVGRKTKRPAVKASQDVVITAAADVPEFATGQRMDGMSDVAQAVLNRVRNFPKFNLRAAQQANEASGGQPVLSKFGTASFGVNIDAALTAGGTTESGYEAVKEATKRHVERITASLSTSPAVQTAALAWCSPSEVVYNWIADYVVDGLLDLPEVAAPRGGLMLTEGPRLAQTKYGTPQAIDEFGFGGTEAEMEAGYVKTCETIECPDWQDHRLDFDGYCWKIPILTEATFPELVADAMRLSDVLYAHKMNRRFIKDVLAQSTAVDATNALGGTMLDTLEAFTQVAIKERRWWNLGENAVMEVKLPQEARHIFKFDMARRSGLALSDTANDAKVAAHFAAYNLAVTYISDFDQRYGAATPTADWPETIRGIMYPAGTFLKSVKPVINLSAVYDAASLSENEYTGVFFEQGVMTIKRGYRSHVIEVPVCVAGRTGANDLTCGGFETPAFDGSF